MTIQQMLLGSGGGGGQNLASLFGVNPNSSTDVRVQAFSNSYTASSSMPTNAGWSDFPHTNQHSFFCSYIHATNDDNLGVISNLGVDPVTNSTVHSLVPDSVPNWGTVSSSYNPPDMLTQYGYSGLYASSYNYLNGDTGWWVIRFNNGLQSTLGLVLQGYSYNHQSMLLRVVCNGIVKMFAPKGPIWNVNTGTSTNWRFAYYPTKAPIVNNTNYFDSYTGLSLPASIFEY